MKIPQWGMDWKGTITMNGNDNYPINLLDEIAGGRWEDDLPKDITGSLEYVLEGLPERDGRVIRARFRDKKSLEEIAKSENVSRERIRQITVKAIKKLAHPLRRNYLIYGVKGMENRAVQQAVSKQLFAATKSILDISESLGNALPDSLGSLKFTEIDELDLLSSLLLTLFCSYWFTSCFIIWCGSRCAAFLNPVIIL